MLLLLCPLLLFQSCWLEAARGLEEAVKCESITEASLGEEANFSCMFLLPMNVLQVTWQKINGSSFQNIATYSQAHGLRVIGSFQRKARFIRAALNTSAITLQNLTFEDVSCYRCIFNVFPRGSFSSKDICLDIQRITESQNCRGWKRPPEIIESNIPCQNRLLTSGCTESGNTDKPEDKMLDLFSPNVRGIQKRIGLVVVFIGAVLAVLIFLIMRLINRKRRRLQKQRAHSTPEKEKGLQQDVSEQSKSLNMLEDQDSSYQNKRQTPGSSFHKRPLNLRRNLEENKGRETWKRNKKLVFSEEADSQDSAIPNMELTELCNNDLGCTLMKNNSETEACEESELHPAMATPWPSSGEQSAHQSPVSTSPEEH